MIELKFIRHFKDVLKFNQIKESENKICFYCEGQNYWPHLKPIVESLLAQSDEVINYVTSDENDPALKIRHKLFNTFVIGDGFIRNYFFDNLNSEIVVMTMPDLDQYQIKKSKKVKQFVYVHHSLVSHHMVYRPKAFDAFDVVLSAGPHHNDEISAMIKTWDMPAKQLINHGYGRMDSIISNLKSRPENSTKKILIAPSWGESGTIELIGEKLVATLLQMPYEVILRPHPQTLKFSKEVIENIVKKYASHNRFSLEVGIDSELSLHQSDVMISDWSGAALDYAFGLLKPVVFIDVPKKIQNPKYTELSVAPFESLVRDEIGVIQSMDLNGLDQKIEQLIGSGKAWENKLLSLRKKHVYNTGTSGSVAARAIMEMI